MKIPRRLSGALRALADGGLYWGKRLGVRPLDFGDRRTAVIPRFHSVSDPAKGAGRYVEPGICVPPALFERQVALLASRYRCVSMDAVAEALAGGRSLPRNAAVITFDDGYRDNYDVAYPILKRYGVPAIFYIATECLDGGPPLWTSELRYLIQSTSRPIFEVPAFAVRADLRAAGAKDRLVRELKRVLVVLPRKDREAALEEIRARTAVNSTPLRTLMLTWDQVREMRRGGMEFGAHTVSHPLLPHLPLPEADEEISRSQLVLEAQLKEPIRHFSYPNPGNGLHFNSAVKRFVEKSGYVTAVTSQEGYVHVGDDALALRRVWVSTRPWGMALDLEREALRGVLARRTGATRRERAQNAANVGQQHPGGAR